MNDQKQTTAEQELYFLIVKFLKSGPCREAAQALVKELSTHKILQKRVHWTGREDEQSFDDLAAAFPHIGDNYLLQVLRHSGPLLDRIAPPSVSGIQSLLGAGRQSLLRSESDIVNRMVRTSLEFALHKSVNIRINSATSSNIAQVISGRHLCGSTSRRNVTHDAFYDKLKLHRRVLGHLAPVYCLLVDRTGSRIFTGADDNLVKIWSLTDGRLLMTLRGHQSEIADISLNCENTLLASGGLDKTVRVWDVKTGAPVAVLHGHSGGITSVEFSPSPFPESRCLISTGKDGSLCIWRWDSESNEFGSEPLKFNERQRVGDQLLCSAFSPGGSFLATGGTDHTVRVYRVNPPPAQQIAELHGHTDQVLSMAFSRRGNRFLTGSDDGTARVWQYLAGQWRSHVLSMFCRKTKDGDDVSTCRVSKLKVTMISWSCNDRFIITAANDTAVRIWNSGDLSLSHMLKGHQKDVYVLETHSVDERILLTAGHDGHIILWNIELGVILKEFENKYDSDVGVSGGAALLEGKSSADGLTYILSDCQGSLSIFGFGSSVDYEKVPDHQFFHTDFRPLIRDANGYVLDEQTQLAPHLMPPPYLVNADGNPYPPEYQQIVCSCRPRHKCEQSANVSEEARILREYVEGSDRLDAVIARLQREHQGFATANIATDSSDSGVGSSQIEESNIMHPPGTATSNLSHADQRTHQPSHVTFADELLHRHSQFTETLAMSDVPGSSRQVQLTEMAVHPPNAMYGHAYDFVGGALQQPPPVMSWPPVGVPLTHAGSLQNSIQQPVCGVSSWMAPGSSFSASSGVDGHGLYQSPQPASSSVNMMQPPGVGMNLHHIRAELPSYSVVLPAASQTASLTSRLCPIAPNPEQVADYGAPPTLGNVHVGSFATEARLNQSDAVPFQSQPRNLNVSNVEPLASHDATSSQGSLAAEDDGVLVNRNSRDVPADEELQQDQQNTTNNEPLSGSVASFLGLDHKDALMWWRSRIIVPDIPPPLAMHQELVRQFLADEELRLFAEESRKLPSQAEDEERPEPVQPVDSPRTQRRRRRNALQQQLAEAAANALAASRGRSRVVSVRSDEEFAAVSSSSSAEEFEEEWHMSSDSSEYSDWTGEVGVSVHVRAPIPRTRRPRFRKQVVPSVISDEDEPEHEDEPVQLDERENIIVDDAGASRSAETTGEASSNARSRKQRRAVAADVEQTPWQPTGAELSAYLPTPWLLQTEPTLNPFFPQLGDKVVYCWQGHEQYINAVILNDVYRIKTKHFPWQRLRLRPQEVCVVLSMHFVVGPPTLCSVKLGILSRGQAGTSVHHTFSLRYHDLADVPDFLIPYSHFKTAVLRKWTPNDRFQCKIDDAWWTGSIVAREPWQLSVPDSLWQCFLVQWDTGEEQEKLSPWDLEVLPDDSVKPVRRGSLVDDLALALQLSGPRGVQTRRQAAMAGPSTASEEQQQFADLLEILSEGFDNDEEAWGVEGEAVARDRILCGLDALSSLPLSQPFQQPVSVEEYPDYHLVVPYPVDLGTIRQRLSNGYYRRLNSFLWDVKNVHKNAATYNEEDSQIVESSEILTELLCKFASDMNCSDLLTMYNQQQNRQNMPDEGEEYRAESGESSDSATEIDGDFDQESATAVQRVARDNNVGPQTVSGESNPSRGKRRRILSDASSESHSLQAKKAKVVKDEAWIPQGVELVEEMVALPISEPFRAPVDLQLYPDYTTYVDYPMDLGTVKRKVQDGQYSSPLEFCKDLRLIFTNSRLYNKVPKSQIVRWTNKLSMYFETRVIAFLSKCGIDQMKLSQLQAAQPETTRARRPSSYDSDDTTASSLNNLDTSESSSVSEESEVEEKPQSRLRTGQGHAINGRKGSKQAAKRTPSSEEESEYGAGAETSSAEYTDSDENVAKQIQRKPRSRRKQGSNLGRMAPQNRKEWSADKDKVAVSRPRRQMAGRRLLRSEDSYSSYGCRPPRQAAVKALENVAMLDLGDEMYNEGQSGHGGHHSGRARSRRFVSWDEGEDLPTGMGQQMSASITRHGRIVRPSTRTRMYSDN